MAYPKPLSKKSLNKMYAEAGITEERSTFYHMLYSACSTLYGAMPIEDLWSICIKYCEDHEIRGITKKQFLAFSSIARREEVPYCIMEADEVFEDEYRRDTERILINKKILGKGEGIYDAFYDLSDQQVNSSYYYPEDLLSYAEETVTREEQQLLTFLSDLTVQRTESEDITGRKIQCAHTGKRLGEFSYRNVEEEDTYQHLMHLYEEKHSNKHKVMIQELEEQTSGTAAEKLVRNYRMMCMLGEPVPSYRMTVITKELTEIGVQMSLEEGCELYDLINNLNDHLHVWCRRGWSMHDLCAQRKAA